MWGYNGSCRVFALFRVSKLHMGTARGSHCQTEGTRQIWPPEYGSLFAHKRAYKEGVGKGGVLGRCMYLLKDKLRNLQIKTDHSEGSYTPRASFFNKV